MNTQETNTQETNTQETNTQDNKTEEAKKDYAIISYAGKEFTVSQGDTLTIPSHIDADDKGEVTFDKVLLIKSGDSSVIGSPTVEGAKVTAKIIANSSDKKIVVFKKKRRQGYKKKQGHRTNICKVQIQEFFAKA